MSQVIGGAFGGGSKKAPAPRTPVVSPDSIRSRGVVEIIDAWGWGEMACFPDGADPLEYVKLDGTPIKSGSNLNFEGVTFDYRPGTQSQTYIPGTLEDAIGSPQTVDVLVENATPVVRTISDPTTDAVRVVLTFSALVVQNATNGDRSAASVTIAIAVRPNGGSWVAVDLKGRGTIKGKTESPYQRNFTIDLKTIDPNATSYDIRVSRSSADPGTNEQSAFKWESLVKLTYAKLRRPNIPHCRLTFDAKYFSSIPVVSYDLLGWLIQVPTADVYNPVTRTYSGADWTGNLIKRWCRNPAWFLYHLLTTAGVGLGADINPAYQDKWQIYTIAQRCDQLVPDGNGGVEPRYSIDAQFMEQTSAHDMIQQIAGVFDAMALWDGKAVYLTQDAPKSVSSLYLPANVIGGRFVYSGSARQVRYTAALIQYNDITNQGRLTTEYVEDFSGIDRYGYRPKSETMVGCISRGEAHRRGKRLLTTSRKEIDSVSFAVGLSGIADKPGDIIRIADPLRMGGQRLGGRIASGATTTVIPLDAPVTLASGVSYRLSIIGNDGAVWDRAVSSAAGTHNSLTVSPAFSAAPEPELEWLVYDPAAIGQTYRILGVTESDDPAGSNGLYSISAIQYAGDKFAEIDSVEDLEPIPVNPFITNGVIPPSGLQVSEGIYTSLEGVKRYLDLHWTASNDPLLSGYELSYRHNGVELFAGQIGGQSYRVDSPLIGVYEITIRAINLAGQYSSAITITHTLTELYAVELVSITNLALPSGTGEFTGRNAFFTWSTNADTVLAFSDSFALGQGGQSPWFRDFEVRIYSGATLLRTSYVTETSFVYSFEHNTEDGGPRRTFTAKVRARDYYGRYSQEASLTATNPPPSGYNAVTLTAGPGQVFVEYLPPGDPDYLTTRIYAATVSGFTPGPTNLKNDTRERVSSFPAETGTWYVRLQGIDEFGPSGAVYSDEVSVSVFASDVGEAVAELLADPGRDGDFVIEADRFLIVQPSTTTPKLAVFGVGTLDGVSTVGIKGNLVLDGSFHGRSVVANSIAADKLLVTSLSAVSANMGTLTAGTVKTSPGTGWRVELSDAGTMPIWYGTGAKTAGNAKFYLDNAGNAFFSGQLSGATGTFSGALTGGTIAINTGVFSVAADGALSAGAGKFTVAANGTLAIRDAANNVIFSSGSGIEWSGIGGAGKPQDNATVGAPAGTLVNGVAVATITTAVTNFNSSNDRNATAVVNPSVLTDGTAVDHTLQANGSADISFEWVWSGAEGDIDGFLVYVRQSSSSAAYTFGTTPAEETVYTVPANKRAFILFGVIANLYYSFGIQAYRSVDKDINASGVIKSTLVKATATGENPYRPSTSVAFSGNVTGTVNGVAATSVNVWNAISGTGKPADNATVGATIGTNVSGQINAGNVSTFIANAAINNAQIANAAITQAKIGDAEVGTLKIAGDAVTVPIFASATQVNLTANTWTNLVSATIVIPAGINSHVLAYINADAAGFVKWTNTGRSVTWNRIRNFRLLRRIGAGDDVQIGPAFSFISEALAFGHKEFLGPGTYTYTLQAINYLTATGAANVVLTPSILLLGTKR